MDIDTYKRKIGKSIRALREEQGVSQRRFALMIGLGQSYLSDIENGRRNIGIENICKIAEGLGDYCTLIATGVHATLLHSSTLHCYRRPRIAATAVYAVLLRSNID